MKSIRLFCQSRRADEAPSQSSFQTFAFTAVRLNRQSEPLRDQTRFPNQGLAFLHLGDRPVGPPEGPGVRLGEAGSFPGCPQKDEHLARLVG